MGNLLPGVYLKTERECLASSVLLWTEGDNHAVHSRSLRTAAVHRSVGTIVVVEGSSTCTVVWERCFLLGSFLSGPLCDVAYFKGFGNIAC